MTIDEAIRHCEEVAEQNETKALRIGRQYEGTLLDREAKECRECAADHRQLAEWLTELKQWRRVYGICPSYEMCIPECREGYDAQIAEYKRLLKAAVEDIHELLCDKKNLDGNGQSCNICSYIEWCHCCKECTIREDLRNWRYADEALKLIEKGEQNCGR